VNLIEASRRRKAERRRDQLIDTALAVFAEKGVHAATVKDLSAAAGVATGLLYHYFHSKDDLLYAALERRYFVPELRRIASPERAEPAAQVLGEVAAEFAEILRSNQQFVRVVMQEALLANPVVCERIERGKREAVSLLAGFLDSRVAAGELRPHDVETTAQLLLFAVLMAHFTGTSDAALLRRVVDTIIHGVAAS
jgi:TetR/AcrR family transcriptional regulator, cholesterol catabolism regulator